MCWGVGEMATKLRALASLQEDPDPIPSSHLAAHTVCYSSSKESDTILLASVGMGMDVVHRHTCWPNTHTYKCRMKKVHKTINHTRTYFDNLLGLQ